MVGLHVGYVRPRALSSGQEVELPNLLIVQNNYLGKKNKNKRTALGSIANMVPLPGLVAVIIQDLTVSSSHARRPVTQPP